MGVELDNDALEAAINADVPGGAKIADYLDFNARDAAEIGVKLETKDDVPRFHWHSDIRADEHQDARRAIIGAAIKAYLAALPPAPHGGADRELYGERDYFVEVPQRPLSPPQEQEAAPKGEAVAWLKEWISDGEPRSRVDRDPDCERWLQRYNPVITALVRGTAPPTPKAEPVACPFCGSPGELIHPMGMWKPGGYGPDGSRISCTGNDCHAMTPAVYGEDQDARAWEYWNRRTVPSSPKAEPEQEAVAALITALLLVRGIIADGAQTGFNCHDGDWAERLHASQADTFSAVEKAGVNPRTGQRAPQVQS